MTPSTPKFVVYLRVSTAKQGRSGLGLEAQHQAVTQFVAGRGGKVIAPEFIEVETGKRNERPELGKALKRCRLTGATLVAAKLDRLSRNAAFLMTLRDIGVDFVAADLPATHFPTVFRSARLLVFLEPILETIGDRIYHSPTVRTCVAGAGSAAVIVVARFSLFRSRKVSYKSLAQYVRMPEQLAERGISLWKILRLTRAAYVNSTILFASKIYAMGNPKLELV